MLNFTFVRKDETELPGWVPGSPPVGYRGPLTDVGRATAPDQIPGYPALPMGTVHTPQVSGETPRRINYDRTLLLPPGQEFAFPPGMPRLFSCAVFNMAGEELFRTWLPAVNQEDGFQEGARIMRFVGTVSRFEAAFPDSLPPLVRVVDEINPIHGAGRLEFVVAINNQDFGLVEDPLYRLRGNPLLAPRINPAPAIPARR